MSASNGNGGSRRRLRLAGERRPLLRRSTFSHEPEREPLYSCISNLHSHLPIYTNIHRIRRDIIAIVEDTLTVEQFRDVRINLNVVRPLVDKLYALDDISVGMTSDEEYLTRTLTMELRELTSLTSLLSIDQRRPVHSRAGAHWQPSQRQLQPSCAV